MAQPKALLRDGTSVVHVGADYTPDEAEFLRAVGAYQKATGRKFPTFVEVLRIAHSLGYRKVPEAARVQPVPPA